MDSANTVYPISVNPDPIIIYTMSGNNKQIIDMTLNFNGNYSYTSGTLYKDSQGVLAAQRYEQSSTKLTEARFVIGFPGLMGNSTGNGSLSQLAGVGTIYQAELWLENTPVSTTDGWVDVYPYLNDWNETGAYVQQTDLSLFATEGDMVTSQGVGNSNGYASMSTSSGSGNWYNFSINSIVRDWLYDPVHIDTEEDAQGNEIPIVPEDATTPQRGLIFRAFEEDGTIAHYFSNSEGGSNSIGLIITYDQRTCPVSGGRNGDPFGCTCSVHGGDHDGLDINGVAEGTPIVASGYGKVICVNSGGGFGNYVIIRYLNHFVVMYAHMQSTSPLQVGAKVYSNTVIGYVGKTGNVTGIHLHMEVARDFPVVTEGAAYNLIVDSDESDLVDPEDWLEGNL